MESPALRCGGAIAIRRRLDDDVIVRSLPSGAASIALASALEYACVSCSTSMAHVARGLQGV